jgi:hypothetical protein
MAQLVIRDCSFPVRDVLRRWIDRDHPAPESLRHDETVTSVTSTDVEHRVVGAESERFERVEYRCTRTRIETATDRGDRCLPVPIAVHLLHGHGTAPIAIRHVIHTTAAPGYSEIRTAASR